MEQKLESDKLEPGLLDTIRRFGLLGEILYHVALMRYYQKAFFKERDNAKKKQEYLAGAKKYEKLVDDTLDQLWPSKKSEPKQSNLFQNENR